MPFHFQISSNFLNFLVCFFVHNIVVDSEKDDEYDLMGLYVHEKGFFIFSFFFSYFTSFFVKYKMLGVYKAELKSYLNDFRKA